MSGHRARVAKAEIDVAVAVDVEEVRALRFAHERRKAPAHFTIQFMGTPASRDLRARSKRAFDFGRSSTKLLLLALHQRDCRRLRSIWVMGKGDLRKAELTEVHLAGEGQQQYRHRGRSHEGLGIPSCDAYR